MKIYDLKNMLYFEINRYNDLKRQISDLKLQIELLKYLNDFVDNNSLTDIYNNYYNLKLNLDTSLPSKSNFYFQEFLNAYYVVNNYKNNSIFEKEYNDAISTLKELKKLLKEDQEELISNLKLFEKEYDYDKLISYKIVSNSIRYNQFISNPQKEIIKKLLISKNITDKDIIILFENIKLYNIKIKEKRKTDYKVNIDYKYEILNMINIGFEKFPIKNINEKSKIKIENEVEKQLNIWPSYCRINNRKGFVEQLPTANKYIYTKEEVEFFYSVMMNKIQENILEEIKMIGNKDFYFDNEIKRIIVSEYRDLLDLYKIIRCFYDKELELQEENIQEEQVSKKQNHLIFIKRNEDTTYFEKDLENVPEEYYEKIIYLLEGKRNNTLKHGTEDKSVISDEFKNMRELRNDQIRIIYSHIKDNYYKIDGVFVKKDDNDLKRYRNLNNRDKNNKILDYQDEEEVYQKIIEYCNNFKRKGNR